MIGFLKRFLHIKKIKQIKKHKQIYNKTASKISLQKQAVSKAKALFKEKIKDIETLNLQVRKFRNKFVRKSQEKIKNILITIPISDEDGFVVSVATFLC